ncbi:MAG: hypothetical protein J6V09_05135 [Clostridia bacterium]|nr:hypothetical protein [Clostridia bacterium]
MEKLLCVNEKRMVNYDDFGAVGDGVADDFAAVYKAHVYANENGCTVTATAGKTYRLHNSVIGGVAVTIPIKTDVLWTGANFIIDDSTLSVHTDAEIYSLYVFTVMPDEAPTRITDRTVLQEIVDAGLNRNTAKINVGCDGPCMIITYNDAHKVFRRRGYGSYMGKPMQEVILLDKDGNVDENTPVIFDYNNLSCVDVYSLKNVRPLTIEGGVFTTLASRINIIGENRKIKTSYFNRGIDVTRSFTTMRNVEHYVEGEFDLNEQNRGMVGAIYHGFFSAHNATNVTYENCVFTARRCYKDASTRAASNGGGVGGTYSHNAWNVSNLLYKDCRQSNFWITVDPDTLKITAVPEGTKGAISSMTFYPFSILDKKPYQMYWGSGGTNFCKNVVFDHSTFSRFDAHSGMWGGKIINGSTFNTLALTGGGRMEISDSRWFAEYYKAGNNALITLRSDYGSTWEGEVVANNVKCYVFTGDDPFGPNPFHKWAGIQIVSHAYQNWYYGYTCHFPNIELNNVDFYDIMTMQPVPAGTRIETVSWGQENSTQMHLHDSHTHPYFSVEDKDGDGYIDYPFDHDGDGIVGNTNLRFEDWFGTTRYKHGILDESTLLNLNPVSPPRYLKITANDGADGSGGYKYIIQNTSGLGISNGTYHGIEENMGGFFGSTKFYYGTGEDDYQLGTSGDNMPDSPFSFE